MRKICLILVAISFLACAKLPPFPKISKWIIDTDNNACIRCELIDPEKQTYKCQDVKTEPLEPLSKCNGFFGQSGSDVIAEKNWILDVIDIVKNKCKAN